jgi:chemotaxis protein histidine kinase CheA/ActR/RegA family two-component response regulator
VIDGDGVGVWGRYVEAAVRDTGSLDDDVGALPPTAELDRGRCRRLAQVAFRLGMSSLLVGAEDVAGLALAAERALDRLADGAIDPATGLPVLGPAVTTLRHAVAQLAHPDRSGARVEGLPVDAQRAALDGLAAGAPVAAVAIAAGASVPPPVATQVGPAGAFVWQPSVDDDMIELFFDEATERVEALAGKLVDLERRPDDADLLREVFRDLHTVKGSSAMVGLAPVNALAHAAEDLMGQLRDTGRAADGPVIDALLAALDGLRAMLEHARARAPITIDPAPLVHRLRNPGAAPPPAAPRAVAEAPRASVADATRQTIRVDFDKLDRLLNLVGELVLGRDQLNAATAALSAVTGELAVDQVIARRVANLVRSGHGERARAQHAYRGVGGLGDELSRIERVLAEITHDLDHGTDQLDAISGELREQVMRLRMIPVGGVFRKHVRTVRDLAGALGKRARLELVGDDTELDKLLVEALDEPLLHLVRNSVDHGVEPPEARLAAGKPAEGTVRLEAAHRGNTVEIRIADDGGGMDPARLRAKAVERGVLTAAEADALDDRGAFDLIFRAGFSTAATVSDVSGRGVGMDVVRQTVVSRLKGTIDVESTPGQGSAFVLRLPLTLAIIQVLVARAGGEVFCIPLDAVVRVLAIHPDDIKLIGDREVVEVRGRHVALVRLDHVLELDAGGTEDLLHLVLTEHAGHTYGLVCDHLVGKKEIVIKSLGPLLQNVACVAGATLLGDRCALIVDVPAVIERALTGPAVAARGARNAAVTPASSQILLVEDSDIIRESLRRLLADAGYLVTVAVDGQHGLELAQSRRFDLVSTDVMMPRLDGYGLTRALRAMPEYAEVPIVMVTSRGERIDRVRGFDAGVDEYITKPHDRQLLLRAVRTLLGHGGDDQ